MIPVVIPAYRNPSKLRKCIDSIGRQTVTCSPIIQDNSEVNLGYTAAVNDGLSYATGAYAIILNQDVELLDNCIENAIAFMDQHRGCAIAGFKQLDPDDIDRITHGGTGDILPGKHLRGSVIAGDCDQSKQFVWINGAAMILRLAAYRDIGKLDESFFLVGSDSDYCLRARMKGWEVWYIAEAVCLHGTDGVSSRPNYDQEHIIANDMEQWIDKWGTILGYCGE